MREIMRRIWEVYERDTQRCIGFATKEQAEGQNVFAEVDIIGWANVHLSEEENSTLDNGGYIWCD